MKLFFQKFVALVGIFTLISISAQRCPVLQASLSNSSGIKKICTDRFIDHPDICADCKTIEKLFVLNKEGGRLQKRLKEIRQQKSLSSFSFFAKKTTEINLVNKIEEIEKQCNNISQEYSDSASRLLVFIDGDQDTVLAQELALLGQGLINAVHGISVDDDDGDSF